jgi:hypothetical protein
MLSRGRPSAFQKIVNRVSDLPPTLDAEPGSRIIVRETEDVYGFNALTRMWELIGTLKKVGGKRPEELAAHFDSISNPHKTSLQSVLDNGTIADVTQEIAITGKASSLRLLSGTSAIRVGKDAGNKDGTFWVNAGNQKSDKIILRVVDFTGKDQIVLTGDGSLKLSGFADFDGGFKNSVYFDDKITVSEGVYGVDGYYLLVGGDKGVAFRVAGADIASFTQKLFKCNLDLEVSGNLKVRGRIGADLLPNDNLQLGSQNARWAKAAVVDLDVSSQLTLRSPPNSNNPPLQIIAAAPGHGVTITHHGALGLGTATPEARLDVKGDILIGLGERRLKLSGDVISCGPWCIGYKDDLNISRNGENVIRSTGAITSISGSVKVDGSLVVGGNISLKEITGINKQVLTFNDNGKTVYKAKSHQFNGPISIDASKIDSPFTIKSNENLVFAISQDGTLLGKMLGTDDDMWDKGYFETATIVGTTSYESGRISNPGNFLIDAPLSVVSSLHISGSLPSIDVSNKLRLVGDCGSVNFSMGGPTCKLSFEGKSWEIDGVSKITADGMTVKDFTVIGNTTLCNGNASFNKKGLALTGELNVGGIVFKKVVENIELTGTAASTKFQIPVGVRVEVIILKLETNIIGARFIQIGDINNPDRFASPSAALKSGNIIRGMDHWNQSLVVQKVASPVVISTGAPTFGKLQVTIHYVETEAF